jgi:hypothetical protein
MFSERISLFYYVIYTKLGHLSYKTKLLNKINKDNYNKNLELLKSNIKNLLSVFLHLN